MAEILTNYIFRNPYIQKIPAPRNLEYLYYKGESARGISYELELCLVDRLEFKKFLRSSLDVPKRLGNWDLMNEWIGNMWEALYNPMWISEQPNGRQGVIHGHHRFRLLDAMEVDKFYAYIFRVNGSYKIGPLQLSREVRQIQKKNETPPVRGTVSGTCEYCGHKGRWSHLTVSRVNDVRLICRGCGAENIYPWRGQI